jgi:hypothetical protein
MAVGDRFLFNSVTCAARRLALMNLQGNRHAYFGAFQDTRGGCAIKKSCEPTFDHPVRSYSKDAFGDIFLRSLPPLLYEEGTRKRS